MVLIGALIFQTFTHMVWQRVALDTILENEASEKTLSGIYGKVMVLIRALISLTFNKMVWQRIVFGTILEKVRPGRKPYQEYIEK